jgi:hypothetical protein
MHASLAQMQLEDSVAAAAAVSSSEQLRIEGEAVCV